MAYTYQGNYDPNSVPGGKMIPEGDHELVIIEAEETQSRNNRPMWKFILSPLADEFAKRKLWHYIVLDNEWTDANVGNLIDACGRDHEEWAGKEIRPDMFHGKTVKARIKHEEYQGEMKEKIAYIVGKSQKVDKRKEHQQANTAPAPTADPADDVPF